MIFKSKSKIDMLDQFLAQHDYTSALEAIVEEIKRKPENFNLLLRQAEILGLAGNRDAAIAIYRKLARQFAEDGFYARAIAVTNKLLRLDPEHPEVTRELAGFISAKQEAEEVARQRFKPSRPSRPPVEPTPVSSPPSPHVPEAADVTSAGPEADEPAPAPSAAQVAPPEPLSPRQQAEKEREASRFFAGFPSKALEELLDSTSVRSFAPKETIVREGDPGLSLFLIEEGSVEVSTKDPSGQTLVLGQMGAGEFFGEVAVLTGRPRTATIVATSPVTAIEIYRDDLDRIAARHPAVHEVLRRFYEQRANATVEAMLGRLRARRD
ncbi:MAG TPA: cyclic nucleotide-binding domain-containing protein [Thermoanaerobaculaceae bacterium]|nr:cyclic nucleotide-binding domain-containing protein [Thermoanaerobaculaceae bacterium]HPS77832.1 cyclic nucleotide-binding domain-containing protein [Thermoanaerobaculaceae bacterium]